MKRWSGRIVAIVLGLLCLSVPSARAEIVVADSIDWMAASADVVIRGTIVEVVRGQGFFVDEVWDKVTVQVIETLKGEKQEKVSFVMQLHKPAGGPEPAGLQKSKAESLFFLAKSDKHKKHGPKQFTDCGLTFWQETGTFDLTAKDSLQFVTMDFKILTQPEGILLALRVAVEAQGKDKPRRTTFGVPSETEAYKHLWAGSGVSLIVPVNGRLETLAKEWFKSKDLEYRLLAVRAFAEFKSEENIRLMKDLLRNPEHWQVTSQEGKFRYYPLRSAAYDALEKWKIKVDKPIIEERLP